MDKNNLLNIETNEATETAKEPRSIANKNDSKGQDVQSSPSLTPASVRNEPEQGFAISTGAFSLPICGVPAEAQIELVDAAPLIINKPLVLLEGHAYAVTWTYKRAAGKSIPIRLIIRDDGQAFGEDLRDIDELGIEVTLEEIPKREKLWSASGVQRYWNGERAEAVDVFRCIHETVNRFIDFNRSLTDQNTMCEMIACYVLSTWFLDAFNVVGFIWANGVAGSGKTQLLNVIAELGFLGEVILSGATFASLRTLSEYGATLCIDDSESYSSSQSIDADKRGLLLGGNKKGNTLPLMGSIPGSAQWKLRRVNTFGPRLFSATQLPDNILASRVIVVPLIRSTSTGYTNISPSDYALWPIARQTLIDELWSLSLSNLPLISAYEKLAINRARLNGRALEPWVGILTIAAWLEEKGVSGIYERLEKVSYKYQKERQQFEGDNLPSLVIRALFRCVGYDACDVLSSVQGDQSWFLKTVDIAKTARLIAKEMDLNFQFSDLTNIKIGNLVSHLRFVPKRTAKERGWIITATELKHHQAAFNLLQN